MKRYEAHVTDRVARQLNEAAVWIAEQNPTFAESWFNQAVDKIASLSQSPQRCAVARENAQMPHEVREL